MDIFRLEAWEKEFPELKVIFQDHFGLSETDLRKASLSIRVQRLDRDNLQEDVQAEDGGTQLELFATDSLLWRGLKVRSIPIRPTILKNSSENQLPSIVVKGDSIFQALERAGKLNNIIRLVSVCIHWDKDPIEIGVVILKILHNVSLGSFIQNLRHESKKELSKEFNVS